VHRGRGRVDLSPKRLANRLVQNLKSGPSWLFWRDVLRLIWQDHWGSLAVILVTVLQEYAALWPVTLLGRFVDRLAGGEMGITVWLFLGASVLYPAILHGNTILRHKLFYNEEYRARVEMTLQVADAGDCTGDAHKAGSSHTLLTNAVSGVANAVYYILGSFTPVIVKVVVVSGQLLAYNRDLGLAYVGTLSIPLVMTFVFNKRLQVLRDTQYSVMGEGVGAGVTVLTDSATDASCQHFAEVMTERKNVIVALTTRSQSFITIRELSLIGSQFLVVFMALGMRVRVGLTPGDFTQIVGYTTQVAAAFIGAASVLDAIVSSSRAYHVYAEAHPRAQLIPRVRPGMAIGRSRHA
jgi:ABC-type multidrug transport system fused ATPase/permease subunit